MWKVGRVDPSLIFMIPQNIDILFSFHRCSPGELSLGSLEQPTLGDQPPVSGTSPGTHEFRVCFCFGFDLSQSSVNLKSQLLGRATAVCPRPPRVYGIGKPVCKGTPFLGGRKFFHIRSCTNFEAILIRQRRDVTGNTVEGQ